MKKLIVVLAFVMVASPVMAAVTVSCSGSGTSCDINYSVTGPNSVRAFALDITVSAGTISAVTCSNSSYYIYPGSIQIVSGSLQSYGNCVCSSTYPGTQPGIGGTGVTVEMGSLYTGTVKPTSSGKLLTLTKSSSTAVVTLAANTARGGTVMENPDESPSATYTGGCAAVTDCFPSTYSSYNDWKSMGKPDCWCGTNTAGMTAVPAVQWKFQCDGDIDNKTQTLGQSYRVYTNDYAKLITNWKRKYSTVGLDPCADVDHKSQTLGQSYRVYTNDYSIVISNWKKKDSGLPANCPRGI